MEGPTITCPMKPLGRAARSPAAPSPHRRPQGSAHNACANVRTALGATQTIGPEPDFEVCALMIRSEFVHNSAFTIHQPCTARL